MFSISVLAAASTLLADPHWISKPTGMDIAIVYPKAAAVQMLEGRSVLVCTVTDAGGLTECSVSEEMPTGAGFGEAMLKLASKFRMQATAKDGQSVAGRNVKIPIWFVLPSPTAPAVSVPANGGPEGRVTLDCRVTVESRLDNCMIVGAKRGEEDLGRAALDLASTINANPSKPSAPRPGNSRINIPFVFGTPPMSTTP